MPREHQPKTIAPSLRQDVFMARADGVYVFLDLRQDRYCALPQRVSALMDAALDGAELDPAAERALSAASLLAHAGEGRSLGVTIAAMPTSHVEASPALRPFPALAAAACRWRAAQRLKRSSLADIVGARRAARMRPQRAKAAKMIVAAASQFIAARPYGRAHNACLREALALLLYLGPQGAQADWVFGVKGAPFAAHCWVQQDGTVLNDTAEHVRAYTPILVV